MLVVAVGDLCFIHVYLFIYLGGDLGALCPWLRDMVYVYIGGGDTVGFVCVCVSSGRCGVGIG